MHSRTALLALTLAPILGVFAQDGGAGSTSPEAAGYSCDASKCKRERSVSCRNVNVLTTVAPQVPNCACASTSIPGGLTGVWASMHLTMCVLTRGAPLADQTPQFIVFTA